MKFKKDREVLGDISNKEKYASYHRKCELCGCETNLSIHHHIKQQKIEIEDFSNYSVLCNNYNIGGNNCHKLVDQPTAKQFVRDAVIIRDSEFYGMDKELVWEYFQKLKDGKTIEEMRDKYEIKDNSVD